MVKMAIQTMHFVNVCLFITVIGYANVRAANPSTTSISQTQPKTTTARLPTTRETNEVETYSFVYHSQTHELYAKIDERLNGQLFRKCYIAKLSQQEREAAHTDLGLRALELKTLAQRDAAVEVNVTEIKAAEKRVCGRLNHCRYFRIG